MRNIKRRTDTCFWKQTFWCFNHTATVPQWLGFKLLLSHITEHEQVWMPVYYNVSSSACSLLYSSCVWRTSGHFSRCATTSSACATVSCSTRSTSLTSGTLARWDGCFGFWNAVHLKWPRDRPKGYVLSCRHMKSEGVCVCPFGRWWCRSEEEWMRAWHEVCTPAQEHCCYGKSLGLKKVPSQICHVH